MILVLIEILFNHNAFFIKGVPIRRPELIQLIRDGNEITAYNEHGSDVTKEVLTRLIFKQYLLAPQVLIILDFISQEVDEEVLYNVIRAGDIFNYLERKSRMWGSQC